MKQIRGLDKWLTDNDEQLLWIWFELARSNLVPQEFNAPPYMREQVLEVFNKISVSDQGRSYISDLRKRWSRKKFNNNKNNKSTSITLSPSSLKQLDYLAKSKTRRQVLEEQLKFGSDIQKELVRQYLQAISDNKNKLKHEIALLTNTKKYLEEVVKRKDDEIKKLRDEITQLAPSSISKYLN